MTVPYNASRPGQRVGPQFAPGDDILSRYQRARRIFRNMSIVDRAETLTTGATVRVDQDIEYFAPRIPLPIEIEVDDLFHVWAEGEWLDFLADRFYGDPRLWWVIADHNQIHDPRSVDPGRILRVPNQRRFLLEITPLLR